MNWLMHVMILQVLLGKVLSDLMCLSGDICKCESTNNGDGKELHVDCGSYKLIERLDTYDKKNNIRIECKSYKELKLAQHFNQINIHNVVFEACQLTGIKIRQTISTLGINKVKKLELISIRIEGSLENSYLSNFQTLNDLSITNTTLLLTNESFEGTPKLTDLNLIGNNIEVIPKGVFKQLRHLEFLNLGENKLTNIDSDLFDGIPLRYLLLYSNNLTTLNLNLQSLEELDVSSNSFTSFKLGGLNVPQLTNLKLSQNKISKFSSSIIDISNNYTNCNGPGCSNFTNFTNLNYIDLSSNNLTVLCLKDIRYLNENVQHNLALQLNFNPLESIDLTDLEIFVKAKPPSKEMYNIQIYLNSKHFICDCRNYEFARFLHHQMPQIVYQYIDFSVARLTCNYDLEAEFENVNMDSLTTCDWHIFEDVDKTDCVTECECSYYLRDKSALMNCSNRNLTLAPEKIISSKNLNFVELNLSNNSITELPNYEHFNIKKLNIRNNKLNTINFTQLPKIIVDLHLEHNNLTVISGIYDLNTTLTNIRNLTMSNNPWMCDCDAMNTLDFIRKYSSKILDVGKIICNRLPILLYTDYADVTTKNLCEKKENETFAVYNNMLIAVLSLLSVVFCLLAITYYNHNVKVWLYSHDCTWLVSEESLDSDKKYDVFLSYCHNDEELVSRHLLPGLEGGSPRFNVCIHTRDWVPGDLIVDQITRSVEESRKTIIVLSRNFLDSDWGRTEFSVAYNNGLNERRSRIVVVLYGELSANDLDLGLKTYLATNTYIQWGDSWFWEKLRYALRHKPAKKTRSRTENNILLENANSSASAKE